MKIIQFLKRIFLMPLKGLTGILGCIFGMHVYDEHGVCVYCGKRR